MLRMYAITSSVFPNDPQFNQQSALLNTGQGGGTAGDDIGITHAWSVTTGSAKTVVALMDTGVDYDQQDLYQNIWINQAEIPLSRLSTSLGGTFCFCSDGAQRVSRSPRAAG